ncbi:MAG: hypothetical protein HRU20_13620 [Pseudomonadales bacterium]|nr:hypothetical protein [Pseudomonadales bacterium]
MQHQILNHTATTFDTESACIDATSIEFNAGIYTVVHLLTPVYRTRSLEVAEKVKGRFMRGELQPKIPTLFAVIKAPVQVIR